MSLLRVCVFVQFLLLASEILVFGELLRVERVALVVKGDGRLPHLMDTDQVALVMGHKSEIEKYSSQTVLSHREDDQGLMQRRPDLLASPRMVKKYQVHTTELLEEVYATQEQLGIDIASRLPSFQTALIAFEYRAPLLVEALSCGPDRIVSGTTWVGSSSAGAGLASVCGSQTIPVLLDAATGPSRDAVGGGGAIGGLKKSFDIGIVLADELGRAIWPSAAVNAVIGVVDQCFVGIYQDTNVFKDEFGFSVPPWAVFASNSVGPSYPTPTWLASFAAAKMGSNGTAEVWVSGAGTQMGLSGIVVCKNSSILSQRRPPPCPPKLVPSTPICTMNSSLPPLFLDNEESEEDWVRGGDDEGDEGDVEDDVGDEGESGEWELVGGKVLGLKGVKNWSREIVRAEVLLQQRREMREQGHRGVGVDHRVMRAKKMFGNRSVLLVGESLDRDFACNLCMMAWKEGASRARHMVVAKREHDRTGIKAPVNKTGLICPNVHGECACVLPELGFSVVSFFRRSFFPNATYENEVIGWGLRVDTSTSWRASDLSDIFGPINSIFRDQHNQHPYRCTCLDGRFCPRVGSGNLRMCPLQSSLLLPPSSSTYNSSTFLSTLPPPIYAPKIMWASLNSGLWDIRSASWKAAQLLKERSDGMLEKGARIPHHCVLPMAKHLLQQVIKRFVPNDALSMERILGTKVFLRGSTPTTPSIVPERETLMVLHGGRPHLDDFDAAYMNWGSPLFVDASRSAIDDVANGMFDLREEEDWCHDVYGVSQLDEIHPLHIEGDGLKRLRSAFSGSEQEKRWEVWELGSLLDDILFACGEIHPTLRFPRRAQSLQHLVLKHDLNCSMLLNGDGIHLTHDMNMVAFDNLLTKVLTKR